MNFIGNNSGFGGLFGGDSCNMLFTLLLLSCLCGNRSQSVGTECYYCQPTPSCGCNCQGHRDICD